MAGEPLHCVDYVNKTVAELKPMLRERDVEAEFVGYAKEDRPTGTWYVHDGVMSAAGKARMVASPARKSDPQPMDAACS